MARQLVDLLVLNSSEAITMADGPPGPLRGEHLAEPGIVPGGSLAIAGGEIVAVGTSDEIQDVYLGESILDADGCTILPGFVDPHTHLVFGRTREDEFEMRCLGKTYEEVAAAGGGIRQSVRRFRRTPREEIVEQAETARAIALEHGTTTIEVKSGYGLDLRTELLALEIASELDVGGDVVATFLGAHEVPDEWQHDREGYVSFVCDEMLPAVVEQGIAQFCDVFCEEHVFTNEQTRTICTRARELGLGIKLHADELAGTGGAQLAVELGAISADHLIQIDERGIEAMAASETIAVLLPGTSVFLGMNDFAPARAMIDAGCAVALATDYNPGSSMTGNPQQILTFACLGYGLRTIEAIAAMTRNAAYAIGMGERVGRLAPGYRADVLLTDCPNHRHLAYHHGVNHVRGLIHQGRQLF